MTKKRSASTPSPKASRNWLLVVDSWFAALQGYLAANADTAGLILLVVGGFLTLDWFSRRSGGGAFVSILFGWGALPILMVLLAVSLAILLRHARDRFSLGRDWPWQQLAEAMIGLLLLLMAGLGLTHLGTEATDPLAWAIEGQDGGLAGWLLGTLPGALLGNLIAGVLLLVLAGLGLWVLLRPLGLPTVDWQHLPEQSREWVRRLLPEVRQEPPVPAGIQEIDPQPSPLPTPVAEAAPSTRAESPAKKRQRTARSTPSPRPIKPKPRPDYLPPLAILAEDAQARDIDADVEYNKEVIEQTLASFNVPVEVVDINVGPTVTQYGVKPGYLLRRGSEGKTVRRRVRVSRIKSLADDLALALAAPSLRIEAPVPGKSYVGIEVPNSDSSLVRLRAVLESQPFLRLKSPLGLALGRGVSGQAVAADLTAMPHLLIAGATGSGKSVCINAIIASLLLNNGPDRLRLLLVDPKRVELPVYNGVPHLLAPVVTDLDQVVGALTWLTLQMDDRYRAFARVGARQLEDYNRKVGRKRRPAEWRDLEPLPYLVLVIDEMADLMMAAPDDVERLICRLAQMARATGIHLIISTQRPSVDVVTGLIKANFPSRIAFAVTSQTDSRVILDTPGAEKLLGRGDMLFMRPDSSKLARVQGCFVADKEIESLVRFWLETMPPEELPANVPRFPWTGLMSQLEDHDDLYERALDLLETQERISASWLQRRMRVGYDRAAKLIARMEADGYVGPDEGAGRGREVLLASDDEDEF